jgi:hypothetical protein
LLSSARAMPGMTANANAKTAAASRRFIMASSSEFILWLRL